MNTYELQSRHRMDTPSVDEQKGKHNGPTRAPGDGLLQRCKMGDTSAMLELAWFGDERNRKQFFSGVCTFQPCKGYCAHWLN